jgi:hypothetical protein
MVLTDTARSVILKEKKEETMACKSKGGSCGTTKKTATKTPKKTKK